eukprot:TRINITY_DN7552_c0_g2_i2.p1 TRINITY_DN7552_c0_g2~~TRINITY_DN7552_c0_g2_i2.p1  ORF type:complete len:316 (+),score=132.31 TRINITY_DN7552_c0_g2_i2:140-1087(+)
MAEIRRVVSQLKALAADPLNRSYIVQDKTCLLGLVNFLDEKDSTIVYDALETLHLLTLVPENRPIMTESSATLLPTLKKMMLDFSLDVKSKQLAGNVYANLQKHVSDVEGIEPSAPTNTPVNTPVKSVPFRDATNRPLTPLNIRGKGTPGKGLNFLTEKPFSSNAPIQTAPTRTLTVYIKGLNHAVKPQLESKLVSISGVISFIIDAERRRVTIRTSRTDEEIVQSIKDAGMKGSIVSPLLEGDPEDEEDDDTPDYLPEINQSNQKDGWFSSLVSWGSTTVDERKEAQKRNEQKKTYMSSRLMGHLFSIGESLWQ